MKLISESDPALSKTLLEATTILADLSCNDTIVEMVRPYPDVHAVAPLPHQADNENL